MDAFLRIMPTPSQSTADHELLHGQIQDDAGLVQTSQAGCMQCFSLLFRRYCGLVLAIGYRVLREKSEAEDLVQEVFLTVFLQSNPYDAVRGSVRNWIAQFAFLKALSRRRYLYTRRLSTLEELPCAECDRSRGGEGFCSIDRVLLVEQSLAMLNPPQRRTIELVHFEGYTLVETAALLEESLANTRNQYYRGMKALRKQLNVARVRSSLTGVAGEESASTRSTESFIPAVET
jgi:RNA polymerase sigma-70 factor (ECF subfamily)